MLEVWKAVKGYEGIYAVSDLGRVKGLERPFSTKNQYGTCTGVYPSKILKGRDNNRGYLNVRLYKNKKATMKYIHRLVAEVFICNPSLKGEVNHLDGNKYNNCANNLEWCTHSENVQHAYDTDLIKSRRRV